MVVASSCPYAELPDFNDPTIWYGNEEQTPYTCWARTWRWLTLTVTPCWAASGGGTAAAARCSTVDAPTATSRTMAAAAVRNNDLTTSGAVAAMVVDAWWMAGRQRMQYDRCRLSTG